VTEERRNVLIRATHSQVGKPIDWYHVDHMSIDPVKDQRGKMVVILFWFESIRLGFRLYTRESVEEVIAGLREIMDWQWPVEGEGK